MLESASACVQKEKVMPTQVNSLIALALSALSQLLQGHRARNSGEGIKLFQAEEARTQLFHWVHEEVEMSGSAGVLTREEFLRRLESEKAKFAGRAEAGRLNEASLLLERLVLGVDGDELASVTGLRSL